MRRTHSAWGSKSCSCQSATQVVLRIAMLAGEMRTSEAENGFHLGRRNVHGQQFSREPQIDDAPIRLSKALANMPTLHPALIDAGSSLGRNRTRGIAYRGETVHGIGRPMCYHLRGAAQQVLGSAGEDGTSFHNPYPGSVTGNRPSLRLLVGEACQSAQVTPAGTRPVAAVSMSQVLTDSRGHGSFQGCGADANPGLKMAGAGLEQDTRLMAIGSHAWQGIGRVIQVEENIAGVARLGEGEKIDVKALKVACTQEAQYRSPQQLTNIPHSFAWARPSCEAMNQANEIELIRHGRKLAADCVQRKEESAIKHGPENAAKYFGLTIIFQRTVTTPLTLCLSPRVHSKNSSAQQDACGVIRQISSVSLPVSLYSATIFWMSISILLHTCHSRRCEE